MIRKLLKFFLISMTVFVMLGALLFFIMDKPLPSGTIGLEAEQLADEMLAALNKEAYDSMKYLDFTFREDNRYQWDRVNNQVVVKWKDQEVFVDLNRSVDLYSELEYEAYANFINGSFWLVAPFKIRDDGVIRSTVEVEGGRGLLATYSSGGVTPGDNFLWIIDENGFPKAWKLWTSNVAIGGLEFSWTGWKTKEGAWFSTLHEGRILDIPLELIE